MLKLTRRLQSTLVKAEASHALNTIIEDKKQYYDMASFQTDHMKEFFDKNGLIIPVDTIIEKYKEEDFEYFLAHKNFLKVTDTLEKFGSNLDMDHEDARKFVLFKKKLYKLYEVRARSDVEHAEFSTEVREEELTHVYNAHKYHINSLVTDNYIKRYTAQKQLKGAYYKRKLLSPARIRGLSSTILALSMYVYHPYLWPHFAAGIILPKLYTLTPIAASLYGLYNLSENNIINNISRIDSGSDKGMIKISIAISPIVSKHIIADPKHVTDGGRIANLDLNAIKISQGFDSQTGNKFTEERVYTLETQESGNAWVDQEGMDWVLHKKIVNSQTDSLYAELIHERAKQIASSKRESKDLLQELKFAIEN
jgi:hypothetical protein